MVQIHLAQMNSHTKISLLLALLFMLAACNKQPATDAGSSPTAPAQAVPFKSEVYQTLNLSETITLISADELEHHKGDFNLVCKYTKQGDTLRLVENVMGTTQAVYFKITPQGLRGNDGTVLYSPSGRTKAIEDIKLAQQRQQDEILRSRVQTREISSFDLTSQRISGYYMGHQNTPNKINITDVSVRLDFPNKEASETAHFFELTNISNVFNPPDNGSIFELRWVDKGNSTTVFQLGATTEKQTEIIRKSLLQAYSDWKEKFPHVPAK